MLLPAICRLGVLGFVIVCGFTTATAGAAELIQLTEKNFDQLCPRGKEPDAIYGDWVLRNEHMVAILAAPVAGRNANMTVRNVGGMLIDLTARGAQSDQLSCFYPGGGRFTCTDAKTAMVIADGKQLPLLSATRFEGRKLEISFVGAPLKGEDSSVTITYMLGDGDEALAYRVAIKNQSAQQLDMPAQDSLRCDGQTFKFGNDDGTRTFWAEDRFFNQAYGWLADVGTMERGKDGRSLSIKHESLGSGLDPNTTRSWSGKIICSHALPGLLSLAGALRESKPIQLYQLKLNAPDGVVKHATVEFLRDGHPLGLAESDSEGWVRMRMAQGKYQLKIMPLARDLREHSIDLGAVPLAESLTLTAATRVKTKIVDQNNRPIPAKIQFIGMESTQSPDFGPESSDHAVRNLLYTANGVASSPITPGKYTVIASHGPEYDAVTQTIEIQPGHIATVEAKLVRTVDSSGWVSGEFHSHSSPSGDNTSSQLGRVLNLLAEHLEFAPCTEHNRIDSYDEHLIALGATKIMATCTGMELTGSPLPVNHQNAFPLHRHPHTQDGGGPTTDVDPVVQIERLAMWDNNSDKVVQMNHPNLPQILGDRDLDGKADEGFRKMLDVLDVVEIHPLDTIFSIPSLDEPAQKRGSNRCFYWMQLLNLGYRMPGVVNTDAHYNFHGSGWLRNYIASSTDDPAQITTEEMIRQIQAGHMVMSTAPFMQVSLKPTATGGQSVTCGDRIDISDGLATLSVRVQCANWYDINRVQVFFNGRPQEKLNFTRAASGSMFKSSNVRFEAEIKLPKLTEDTHIIVAAIGEGLSLGDVMGPVNGKLAPAAVSNPIYVNVDGGKFKPNADNLGVPFMLRPGEAPAGTSAK